MISPTLLYRGTLGSSAATVATTSVNGQTTINSIVATNKTANARVFSITVGGVYFAYLMPIAAYQTITLDVRQVANPGTAIQAWADAITAVDLSISCALQTPSLYLGSGTGSPEGVLTANQGAEWVQTDDSQLTYLKWRKLTGSGNTGWYPDFEGRWKTWTATLTQGVSVTFTASNTKYSQVGKLIVLNAMFAVTSSGTNNTAVEIGGLPVNQTTGRGSFRAFDSGVTNWVGTTVAYSATSIRFHNDGNGNYWGQNPMQLTSGDSIELTHTYEAV